MMFMLKDAGFMRDKLLFVPYLLTIFQMRNKHICTMSFPIKENHCSGGVASSNHLGGSKPDPPRGLQRQRRQAVNMVPFATPYFL